ncbi:hypothetical protein [Bradyrhizobium oligotrophicum]|uniref:hypothetical protein n=1 Tax=Bradyrhizobium oligotrophicum TaxID=44255 RepID=UPI003EC0759D
MSTRELDPATLAAIASIIAAFGVAMLFFRIQRELQMSAQDEIIWLPWADWLLVFATLVCLFFVILPLIFQTTSRVPTAAAGAATVLVGGYIFAILGHYRILFGRRRTGPRYNPEPAERVVVLVFSFLALVVFAARAVYWH